MTMQIKIVKVCSKHSSPNALLAWVHKQVLVRHSVIIIAGDCHSHKDFVLINSSEGGLTLSLTIINLTNKDLRAHYWQQQGQIIITLIATSKSKLANVCFYI